jgi:Protein of unknown function (DUF2905)
MSIELGKILIILGILLAVVGLIAVFRIQIPWLGKLPGDFYVKRNNVQIYFPLATCILLSLLLSAILYLFRK